MDPHTHTAERAGAAAEPAPADTRQASASMPCAAHTHDARTHARTHARITASRMRTFACSAAVPNNSKEYASGGLRIAYYTGRIKGIRINTYYYVTLLCPPPPPPHLLPSLTHRQLPHPRKRNRNTHTRELSPAARARQAKQFIGSGTLRQGSLNQARLVQGSRQARQQERDRQGGAPRRRAAAINRQPAVSVDEREQKCVSVGV
jgi:hypothetical protein